MFKNIFFAGLAASIFGTLISVAYIAVFKYSPLEADFSEKASFIYLLSLNTMVGMVACFLYFAMAKLFRQEKIAAFIVGFLLSGAAIVLALQFMFTVDNQIESAFKNENAKAMSVFYYYVLAPIAFFPVLSWFTFKPLFIK